MNATAGQAWAVVRWTAEGAIRVVGVYASYDAARQAQNLQLGWREQVVETTYHTAGPLRSTFAA